MSASTANNNNNNSTNNSGQLQATSSVQSIATTMTPTTTASQPSTSTTTNSPPSSPPVLSKQTLDLKIGKEKQNEKTPSQTKHTASVEMNNSTLEISSTLTDATTTTDVSDASKNKKNAVSTNASIEPPTASVPDANIVTPNTTRLPTTNSALNSVSPAAIPANKILSLTTDVTTNVNKSSPQPTVTIIPMSSTLSNAKSRVQQQVLVRTQTHIINSNLSLSSSSPTSSSSSSSTPASMSTPAVSSIVASASNTNSVPSLQTLSSSRLDPTNSSTSIQNLQVNPSPVTSTINLTTNASINSNTDANALMAQTPNALTTETESVEVNPMIGNLEKTSIQMPQPTGQSTSIEVPMSIDPPKPLNETPIKPNITTKANTSTKSNSKANQYKSHINNSQMHVKTQDGQHHDEPITYICCLMDNDVRCERVAGNASFSRRIQKIVSTKKMNFTFDPNVRHTYICEYHKGLICVAKKNNINRDTQSNSKANNLNSAPNNVVTDIFPRQIAASQMSSQNLGIISGSSRMSNNHHGSRNNVSSKSMPMTMSSYSVSHNNEVPMDIMVSDNYDGGEIGASSSSAHDVDLHQLQVNTLRRYKKHFRVQTRPGLNKLQLAESLKRHFRTMPIIEKEAITYFVYIVKCFRNKLDHTFQK